MNYLLNYVRTHKNWKEKLQEPPFNLMIKTDEDYPDLYLFKYTITSDMSLPLVQEARGTILEIPECRKLGCYVSRPFKKFFNYGEPYAAKLDDDITHWSIIEKMDGSMIQVYFYQDKLMIGTSGVIDATKNSVNGLSISFGELFMSLFRNQYFNLCWEIGGMRKDCTYLFELTTHNNRIVIDYPEDNIWLLDVIYTEYGTRAPQLLEKYSKWFKVPKQYTFKSMEELVETVKKMDISHEGVVITDRFGERLKVKGEKYFEMHHAWNNGNISEKRILKMIQEDSIDDFISLFPRYEPEVNKVQHKFYKLVNKMWKEAKYMASYFHLTPKEFAYQLDKNNIRYEDLMWRLYRNQTSIYEYLFNMTINKLVKIVNEIGKE